MCHLYIDIYRGKILHSASFLHPVCTADLSGRYPHHNRIFFVFRSQLRKTGDSHPLLYGLCYNFTRALSLICRTAYVIKLFRSKMCINSLFEL
jgi:hypothetical protein